MTESSVAVVILNYNRERDLIECVTSLKESTHRDLSLLVVDNGSYDESVLRMRETFPDVEVIETGTNLGYARGMNQGIQHALRKSPRYLLIMNSDTIVHSEYVSKLAKALDDCPEAAAASGTIYYHPPKEKVWYGGGDIIFWRGSGFSRHAPPVDGVPTSAEIQKVTFVSGCAFLVRADVLRRVGLFDEQFFMYLEDTDLSARMVAQSLELLYVPGATIFHKVSPGQLSASHIYFSIRNRLLFLKLRAPRIQKLIGFSYLSFVYGAKIALWGITAPSFSRAALFGVIDFLRGRLHEGRGLDLTTQRKGVDPRIRSGKQTP